MLWSGVIRAPNVMQMRQLLNNRQCLKLVPRPSEVAIKALISNSAVEVLWVLSCVFFLSAVGGRTGDVFESAFVVRYTASQAI